MPDPRSLFGRLLRRRRTPPAAAAPVAADPMRTATALTRLRDLELDSNRETLTLGGQLAARRAAVVTAVREDRLADAEALLGQLAADQAHELTTRHGQLQAGYGQVQAAMTAVMQPHPQAPAAVVAAQQAIRAADTAWQAAQGKRSVPELKALLAALVQAVKDARTALEGEALRHQQARDRVAALQEAIAAALQAPAGRPPDLLRLQGELKAANDSFSVAAGATHAEGAAALAQALADKLGEVQGVAAEQTRLRDQAAQAVAQLAGTLDAAQRPLAGAPEALGALQKALQDRRAAQALGHAAADAAGAQALVQGVRDALAAVEAERLRLRQQWEALAGRWAAAKDQLALLQRWGDTEAAATALLARAVDDSVAAGEWVQAAAGLPAFEKAAAKDLDAKRGWYEGQAKLRDAVGKKIDGVTRLAAPFGAALAELRKGVDKAVEGGDFGQAAERLAALDKLARAQHAALATHVAGLQEMKPLTERATLALADNTIDFGTRKTDYDAALKAMHDAVKPQQLGTLAGLRAACKAKAEAVLDHYRDHGTGPDHDSWLSQRFDEVAQIGNTHFYRAMVVPPITPKIGSLRDEVRALMSAAKARARLADPARPAAGEVQAWEAVIAKTEELLKARDGVDAAEARLHKQYRPHASALLAAEKAAKATTPATPESSAFLSAWSEFTGLRDTDRKFLDAAGRLAALRAKADALLAPQVAAARNKVGELEQLAAAADRSSQARDAIAGGLSDFQLAALTPAERASLMTSLRADGSFGNDAAMRRAQARLYRAMDLDKAFLAEEKKGRKAMVDSLSEEQREDLQEARSGWAAKSLDDKRKVLESVVKAQCKAFGFDPPVLPIEFYDNPSVLDNGAFRPSTGKIVLNQNSVAVNDFEAAVDLVIHENHHNFQKQMVSRLGLADSDAHKIKPGDPLFEQATMFALNSGPGAYVKPGEGLDDYMKQPMEDHSWYSGPKTSRGLLKALA